MWQESCLFCLEQIYIALKWNSNGNLWDLLWVFGYDRIWKIIAINYRINLLFPKTKRTSIHQKKSLRDLNKMKTFSWIIEIIYFFKIVSQTTVFYERSVGLAEQGIYLWRSSKEFLLIFYEHKENGSGPCTSSWICSRFSKCFLYVTNKNIYHSLYFKKLFFY